MFQALIAEDSKPILRNLKALIHTSGLPIQVAAVATNGEEALEICQHNTIDILITDIRMPKMDGLTLIDQAKRINAKLKVVLISGYNDFEYTRKAINLQVCDYLLKPVERNQMMEVMERVVAQLKEEHHTESSVFDGILDPSSSRLMKLEPVFFEQSKLLWVVRKHIFTPLSDHWNSEIIKMRLTEAFEGHPFWLFPTQDPLQLLILTNASFIEGHNYNLNIMEKTHNFFVTLGLDVSIACSSRSVVPQKIPESYREISQTLKEQLNVSKPVLLDVSLPLHIQQASQEEINRLGDNYTGMIQRLQKDRFLLQLSEQLSKWQQADLPVAQLERFVSRLVGAFESSANQHTEWKNWVVHEQARKLFEQSSYADFCSELLTFSGECFDFLLTYNKKSGNELFMKIDEHLRTNLYAQVSMSDLSTKFHVSSSYISRIVKKYSQNTFVHHYLDLKIREARRLMETNPEIKIKELSDALCFHDQHYFSKVFKEYVGCSPSEYKAAIPFKPQDV
ncbi:response regulator [Paenibacillus sp. V4I7]|uniref:response regulator n=1 Tax=Paenibacillus sp. V4I7 TaxID=3042307 RepID=UPI00277F97E0|nr:response regulator [Paenibacillus sp. V4I7]MDQ0901943.1 two-component system response regulator YesN [Paenibacillus sp. V4I7]